ncbi:hypothetical protein ACFL5V_05400 [Fibrobacterota bacterium]
MSKRNIVIIVVVALTAGSLLIINNLNSFRREKTSEQEIMQEVQDLLAEKKQKEEISRQPEEEDQSGTQEPEIDPGRADIEGGIPVKKRPGREAFVTGKIICPLKVDPMLYVILQAEALYTDKGLKDELDFRKKDMDAVIQNILYNCEREELTAPLLRRRIITAVNDLLTEGEIEDLAFKDFKIEIRKK